MPSVLYSAIFCETTLLCEATAQGAAFLPLQDMGDRVGEVLEKSLEKQSYPQAENTMHCLVEKKIVFLVLASSAVSKDVAFGFLLKVKEEFKKTCGEIPANLKEKALDKKFKRRLAVQMKVAETNPSEFSKIEQVRGKIGEVKAQMEKNVKKAIERGEKIEDLEKQSASLEEQAGIFKKRTKDIEVKERWKYYRTISWVLGVFVVLGVLIWLSICRGFCIS